MALFPCVVGNHKYAGPQQSVYLAALNGTFSARSKQRLCPQHLNDMGEGLESNLQLIAVGEKMTAEYDFDVGQCYQCKSDEAPWQLFANLYRLKQPQMDYYARSCTEHLEPFRETARLEL